jgi:hypothetical protein
MWEYYKEKYGVLGALEYQYPADLQDPRIAALKVIADSVIASIDRIMTEKHPEEQDHA